MYPDELCDNATFCQVEPNTKLFPAVFVQPFSQNMVQLELGKLKVRWNDYHSFLQLPFLKVSPI